MPDTHKCFHCVSFAFVNICQSVLRLNALVQQQVVVKCIQNTRIRIHIRIHIRILALNSTLSYL